MTKNYSISNDLRQPSSRRRDGRGRWRPWFWGLASWLSNGGIVLAFYLALRLHTAGMWALGAFIAGFLLKQIMEATSQGD